MRAKAFDASHHNVIVPEEFPWHLVDAVLVKITEGDYFVDGRWKEHVDNALERGKIVYGYHFYRTRRVGKNYNPNPVDQAQFYLHTLGDYKDDIHGWADDFETGFYYNNDKRYPYNPRLGTESKNLERFHKVWHEDDPDIHKMLYTNRNSWENTLRVTDWLGRGPAWITEKPYLSPDTGLWIAAWGATRPKVLSPFRSWFLHQNTNDWRLPGVYTEGTPPRKRGIDGNVCSLTAEEWRKMVGIGETPPPPPGDYDRGWNAALDASNAANEGLRK